jgi:hypothetical protein
MLFQHDTQESVHGAAAACDLLQDVHATLFLLKGAFDGINLPANTADSVDKFLLALERVTHD